MCFGRPLRVGISSQPATRPLVCEAGGKKTAGKPELFEAGGSKTRGKPLGFQAGAKKTRETSGL